MVAHLPTIGLYPGYIACRFSNKGMAKARWEWGGGARGALVQTATHQLKATGSGVKNPWIDDSSRL